MVPCCEHDAAVSVQDASVRLHLYEDLLVGTAEGGRLEGFYVEEIRCASSEEYSFPLPDCRDLQVGLYLVLP